MLHADILRISCYRWLTAARENRCSSPPGGHPDSSAPAGRGYAPRECPVVPIAPATAVERFRLAAGADARSVAPVLLTRWAGPAPIAAAVASVPLPPQMR